MIIVGLSVVVTVIVLQYHHHDPDGGKMPKWVCSSHPRQSRSPSLKEAPPRVYLFQKLHKKRAFLKK